MGFFEVTQYTSSHSIQGVGTWRQYHFNSIFQTSDFLGYCLESSKECHLVSP